MVPRQRTQPLDFPAALAVTAALAVMAACSPAGAGTMVLGGTRALNGALLSASFAWRDGTDSAALENCEGS